MYNLTNIEKTHTDHKLSSENDHVTAFVIAKQFEARLLTLIENEIEPLLKTLEVNMQKLRKAPSIPKTKQIQKDSVELKQTMNKTDQLYAELARHLEKSKIE